MTARLFALCVLLAAGCGRVGYELELDGSVASTDVLVVAGEANGAELELGATPYVVRNVAADGATLSDQLELVTEAIDSADGARVVVLLMHGETAAATLETANAYPRELELWAYDVRLATGRDDLGWLVTAMRSDTAAGDRVSRATVRYAQQSFVLVDREHRELIDTDALPGKLELDGRRYSAELDAAVRAIVDSRMRGTP